MVIEVTFDVTDVYISTTVSPVYVNVSFEAPSGGGGTEWGDITGTLSDQTDLQTALDGKFDDPTGTSLQYIDGTGALQTFPLTLPVLQEVRNQTGATLDAGTVVYINGATGNKPTVTKAIATGDATSAQTLGMVSASIANNGTGYVVVIGTCSGLDTSAFTEGQQLYLSYTTAGAVTTTKPYAPYHLVYIGIVTRAHPTLGTVEVRVQNGFEVAELHDVSALNPNNNDGLFYNTSTSLWEHKQINTALGYTPANAATTLTINGVTYDLSANRTFSVGSVTGSGASGQVSYWDGTTSQAGSNNLFWDNANGRLGIGTNVPVTQLNATSSFLIGSTLSNANTTAFPLQVNLSNTGSNIGAIWRNASATGYATFRFYNDQNSGVRALELGYSGSSYSGAIVTSGIVGESGFIVTTGNYPLQLGSNNTARAIITGGGNILLGSTSDSGQRLQVQGTTLLNGNVTFSSSTGMFWDATNSRLGIGTNAPAVNVDILGSGTNGNAYLRVTRSNNTAGDAAFITQPQGTLSASNKSWNYGLLANSNTFRFWAYDGTTATTYLGIFNNGNVAIQNGGTFTDSGERLQVTGTMKVTGNVSAGANLLFNTTLPSRHTSSAYPAIFVGNSNSSVMAETFSGYKGLNLNANIVRDGFNWVCQDTTQPGWVMGLNYETANTDEFALYRTPATSSAVTFTKLFSIKGNGYVSIGLGGTAATALTDIGASSTTRASLRIRSGTAPTSPNDGDIWFDGTDIKMRIGGVTKTFTLI